MDDTKYNFKENDFFLSKSAWGRTFSAFNIKFFLKKPETKKMIFRHLILSRLFIFGTNQIWGRKTSKFFLNVNKICLCQSVAIL